MVPYTIPRRHNACVGDRHVGGGPNPIDWALAPEVRGSNLFSRVPAYRLYHSEAAGVGEQLPQCLRVDILVSI